MTKTIAQISCVMLGIMWFFLPTQTGSICGSIFIASSLIIAAMPQKTQEK